MVTIRLKNYSSLYGAEVWLGSYTPLFGGGETWFCSAMPINCWVDQPCPGFNIPASPLACSLHIEIFSYDYPGSGRQSLYSIDQGGIVLYDGKDYYWNVTANQLEEIGAPQDPEFANLSVTYTKL